MTAPRRPFHFFCLVLFAVALVASHSAGAQAVVRGTVYDSLVAHRWLTNATVTIPEINKSVKTDDRGRFSFGPVAKGRYTITFRQSTLDSLDFPAVALLMSVPDTGEIFATLSMPPANSYVDRLCRTASDSQPGVITGSVRDVDDSMPVKDATVVANWTETLVDPEAPASRRLIRRTYTRESRTDENGRYVTCSVSTQFPIFLRALVTGHETAEVEMTLGSRTIAHRSFALGLQDNSPARLVGIIKDSRGRPIVRASVGLRGFEGRARTDSLGRFALRSVPTGTQVLETRVLGAEPHFTEIWFHSNAEHAVQIDLPVVRDRESVPAAIGALPEVRADPTGFELRRRTLKGTFLSATQIGAKSGAPLADVLLKLPHLVLRKFYGQDVIMEDSGDQEAMPGDSTITVQGCTPQYWVDEQPYRSALPGGPFAELSRRVHAGDIRAIEYYEGRQIPRIFPVPADRNACAVVVIWTKAPR